MRARALPNGEGHPPAHASWSAREVSARATRDCYLLPLYQRVRTDLPHPSLPPFQIYKCQEESCPRPGCYKSYPSSKEDHPACERPGCKGTMKLVRHVSFVGAFLASSSLYKKGDFELTWELYFWHVCSDCPGHE